MRYWSKYLALQTRRLTQRYGLASALVFDVEAFKQNLLVIVDLDDNPVAAAEPIMRRRLVVKDGARLFDQKAEESFGGTKRVNLFCVVKDDDDNEEVTAEKKVEQSREKTSIPC